MTPVPTVGDRIRMVDLMPDDPNPIPLGVEGTVTAVNPCSWGPAQISVDWDIKRSLMVLASDPFIIVEAARGQ